MNKRLLLFATISVLCLSAFNNINTCDNESNSETKTIELTLEEANADDNPSLMIDKIVDQGFTPRQAIVISQQNLGNGMWHKELLQQLKPEFHECDELEPYMLKNGSKIFFTINSPNAEDTNTDKTKAITLLKGS